MAEEASSGSEEITKRRGKGCGGKGRRKKKESV